MHNTPARLNPLAREAERATGAANIASDDALQITLRSTAEFLIVLLSGILFARTFLAEAYIVPTGSMAPTLLGQHRSLICPNCRNHLELGADASGAAGSPACPNCGAAQGFRTEVETAGDRLLVQKFLFDLRSPRRWETIVFQNPSDPGQAYVKRVVGLPGESIEIRDGDVWIDGQIARKDARVRQSILIPVYDQSYPAQDGDRFPRWSFRYGSRVNGRRATGWRVDSGRLVRDPVLDRSPDRPIDWAAYRHWQPDRDSYGPITDFLAYNGRELTGQSVVPDLVVQAQLSFAPGVEAVALRISYRGDRFTLLLPTAPGQPAELARNGRECPVVWNPAADASQTPHPDRWLIEASVVDRRLEIYRDGQPLIEPFDFESTRFPLRSDAESPVAIGVRGQGPAAIESFRLWRDVYYTTALSYSPRLPFGIGQPYELGPGEYFVLGDNSAVSNDSRFWDKGPVVRDEYLLGKPFLVHLPSRVVPLQVFGHELYWFPDPRQIRYIR